MDKTYVDLAYERTLIAHISRLLKDKFLSSVGSSPSAVLYCDDLPFNIREVPQANILAFLRRLTEEERIITASLAEYTHTRHQPAPLSRAPEVRDDEKEVEEPKKRTASRRKPGKAGAQAGRGE